MIIWFFTISVFFAQFRIRRNTQYINTLSSLKKTSRIKGIKSMRLKGILQINTKKLIFIQIFMLFICRFVSGSTGISAFVYIEDVITILMLIALLYKTHCTIHTKLEKIILCELFYWIISFCIGINNSITDFIYQLRLIGRFYIVLLATMYCWNINEFKKLFKFLDYVFVIHFIISIYQLYIQNVGSRDAIGGIFGVQYGYGNGASHILIIIVLIITLFNYFNKNENLKFTAIKLIMIGILAVSIEIKSFIFEAMIIVLVMLLINKKLQIRTLILIIAAFFAISWAASYYLDTFNFDIGDIDGITLYIESGYGYNREGIGRTDGFVRIWEECFEHDIVKLIFGYGFGAAGSVFTKSNFGNYNLEYFTYAKIFYDLGVIGVILFYAPFVLGMFYSIRLLRQKKNIGIIGLLCSIFSIYWTFYSNILESDVGGYLFYTILAIAFILPSKLDMAELK